MSSRTFRCAYHRGLFASRKTNETTSHSLILLGQAFCGNKDVKSISYHFASYVYDVQPILPVCTGKAALVSVRH